MNVFRGDTYITRCLEVAGEYSPRERDVLLQLSRSGRITVEIGANIGAHTIPLARKCHPAQLLAFEPQQRVFQVLCANLVANGIDNVIAMPDACGSGPGTALIPALDYSGVENFGGVALLKRSAGKGQPVRVVALDSVELPDCGLIKIDVEGLEAAVLRGAAATIARFRPRLYVENAIEAQQQEVISLLNEMGYRLYWHLPPLLSEAQSVELFGQRLVSINMVCIPRESTTSVTDMAPIDPENWRHPLKG